MERKTEYIIEEELAISIKKITGNITTANKKEKYGLTEMECQLQSNFFDLVVSDDV